jgi:hypothetical protein
MPLSFTTRPQERACQTRRPFGVLEWPALLARLDRIDPSFRD